MVRAAVCLTGYVRTFTVPEVHLGIEALRRSLHDAPLFAVVSNDYGDTFKGQAAPVNESAVASARARVQIADWRVIPGGRQVFGQFVKLAYCAAILEAHERRKRVEFAWVVRLRPDGLYRPMPPGWLGTLNRTTVYQSSNSGDVMWVMPRHTVATMAAIGDTPMSRSSEGDVCCGDIPHRYFECGCDIVRTDVASATIARLGLFPTRDLGDRLDNPTKKHWAASLSTARVAHLPGTARGVTAGRLWQRPNGTDAYRLLDGKPWTAGR